MEEFLIQEMLSARLERGFFLRPVMWSFAFLMLTLKRITQSSGPCWSQVAAVWREPWSASQGCCEGKQIEMLWSTLGEAVLAYG